MHCWNAFLAASCLAFAPLADSSVQEEAKVAAEEIEDTRPVDAAELFERFAEMEGLEVSFSEKKHIALLAVPLESSGKIYFMRPGYLSRVIEKPVPSTLTITPEELRLTNQREQKVVDLRQNAELRAFVTSLLHVFSGNSAELKRSYKVAYELDEKDEAKWSLTLTPLKKPLTEMLRSLRLVGSNSIVTRIEMHEPSGDKTITTVLTNNPKRRFTLEEKKLLFGIETPPEAEKSQSEAKSL